MSEDPTNPSWLNDPAHGAAPTAANPAKSSAVGNSEVARKRAIIRSVFRFMNAGVAVLMAATGAIALTQTSNISQTATVFVALYMILFAAILFIFEVMQVYPCEMLERVYKRNFGFLFGTKGKALFMIFIAFLNLGLSYPKSMAIGTGCALLFLGIVQLVGYLKYPEYLEEPGAVQTYQPST